ncbi:MAG: hypothetical protein ABSH20_10685 [Tepidisphaeraceae bacterium]|jgi:hypothetical protein
MALEMAENAEGRMLIVHATGTLTKDDYGRLVPEVERLIEQHGNNC